jgi:hypothetical protein
MLGVFTDTNANQRKPAFLLLNPARSRMNLEKPGPKKNSYTLEMGIFLARGLFWRKSAYPRGHKKSLKVVSYQSASG